MDDDPLTATGEICEISSKLFSHMGMHVQYACRPTLLIVLHSPTTHDDTVHAVHSIAHSQ